MRRPSVLSLLIGVVLLVAGDPLVATAEVTPRGQSSATGSGQVLDDAAQALRSDPVYVAPDAEASITEAEADGLRERVRRGDAGSVYLMVLPAAAADEAGGVDNVLRSVAERLGRKASYAAVIGRNSFRGGSYTVPGASGAADRALGEHGDEGAAGVLGGFVDELAKLRASGGSGAATPSGRTDPGDSGGGGAGILILIAVIGGGLLLAKTLGGRRRRREEAHQLEELKAAARDDLVALGDDVRSVDIDVEMPDADPRAREHLGVGLAAYEKAEQMLDHARHPEDIAQITRTIDDGRAAMAASRAILDGKEPPERRPPCFFDPRHGPSVVDMPWAPPGGEVREVPVCQADAVRMEHGEEPHAREVMVGGQYTPYYNAPGYFSPWAGGFFGGFGGSMFLPGMMAGTLLGGALAGPGMAWGSGWGDGDWADGGSDWGGGDFGGGSIFGGGGGDGGGFGGGDFGGGDFGGGDFGGGDF
jgi:hypothetical protein